MLEDEVKLSIDDDTTEDFTKILFWALKQMQRDKKYDMQIKMRVEGDDGKTYEGIFSLSLESLVKLNEV